eukprot:m.191926 g.191926  ORF g.191926 m.191926 type:complete len:267 (-) comp16762_c10_seq3:2207-3007(-)
MSENVVVVKDPSSEECVEVPANEDGSLPVSTLESQFPGATGLKFKNPTTGSHAKSEEEGRVCYKCGGNGHIAVMCPSREGARDDPTEATCHLCHGRGHFQSRCPNSVPRNVCFKCGMYGHIGRECGMHGYPGHRSGHRAPGEWTAPYGDPYARPYAPPTYDKACYVCGETGHLAAHCPRSTVNGEKLCHVCRKPGHLARDCTLCRVCLGEGHRSYECPHRGSMPASDAGSHYSSAPPGGPRSASYQGPPQGYGYTSSSTGGYSYQY